MAKLLSKKSGFLPAFFEPLLWSYNFSEINPEKHKEIIIINTINYGNLKHWRWLIKAYGKRTVVDILKKMPITALRPRALRLASIILTIKEFNHAPRGVKR